MVRRVIIAGSRNFTNKELLTKELDKVLTKEDTTILQGGARGADTLASEYGLAKGIPVEVYVADWNKYGKSAGYIRNAEMANKANELIVFWDGVSKGTKHMIAVAEKKCYKVTVIKTK